MRRNPKSDIVSWPTGRLGKCSAYLDDPTEDRKPRLRSLLFEIVAEQNEHVP